MTDGEIQVAVASAQETGKYTVSDGHNKNLELEEEAGTVDRELERAVTSEDKAASGHQLTPGVVQSNGCSSQANGTTPPYGTSSPIPDSFASEQMEDPQIQELSEKWEAA